jgi:hypothetical protein
MQNKINEVFWEQSQRTCLGNFSASCIFFNAVSSPICLIFVFHLNQHRPFLFFLSWFLPHSRFFVQNLTTQQ